MPSAQRSRSSRYIQRYWLSVNATLACPSCLLTNLNGYAAHEAQAGVGVAQAVNADGTHSSKWGKS